MTMTTMPQNTPTMMPMTPQTMTPQPTTRDVTGVGFLSTVKITDVTDTDTVKHKVILHMRADE